MGSAASRAGAATGLVSVTGSSAGVGVGAAAGAGVGVGSGAAVVMGAMGADGTGMGMGAVAPVSWLGGATKNTAWHLVHCASYPVGGIAEAANW